MNKEENFKSKKIINTFAEEFMDDILYSSLFEDPKERLIFLKSFMKAYLHMAKDSYYLWSEDACYALIYDSQKKTSKRQIYMNYYIGLMKGWRIISLVGLKKYKKIIKDIILNGSNWLEEVDDYLHLDLIVVKKEKQGLGLGKKMITNLSEFAKERGMCVTLETQNPKNKDLYEHLDFQVHRVIVHEKYDEYCMIRK